MDTIMTATVEDEKQRRGQAFLQARRRLGREYNCTVTIVPKWMLGVSGTFVLAFDEQVMVGPPPTEEKATIGDAPRVDNSGDDRGMADAGMPGT